MDENFDNDVIRALLRRRPQMDLIRVQDVGLSGADDPSVLAWAAHEGRILLTQDVTTLTVSAYEWITHGQPMPGVVAVGDDLPFGPVIDDLLLLDECAFEGELDGRIIYVPV